MASEKNIAWLRAGGRKHLIGTPKTQLRRFEAYLVDERDWTHIREDVEVKVCPNEAELDTLQLGLEHAA